MERWSGKATLIAHLVYRKNAASPRKLGKTPGVKLDILYIQALRRCTFLEKRKLSDGSRDKYVYSNILV